MVLLFAGSKNKVSAAQVSARPGLTTVQLPPVQMRLRQTQAICGWFSWVYHWVIWVYHWVFMTNIYRFYRWSFFGLSPNIDNIGFTIAIAVFGPARKKLCQQFACPMRKLKLESRHAFWLLRAAVLCQRCFSDFGSGLVALVDCGSWFSLRQRVFCFQRLLTLENIPLWPFTIRGESCWYDQSTLW